MNDENAKKIEAIYNKAIARLKELFKLEKQIISEHNRDIEAEKIEELRNKIKNNG